MGAAEKIDKLALDRAIRNAEDEISSIRGVATRVVILDVRASLGVSQDELIDLATSCVCNVWGIGVMEFVSNFGCRKDKYVVPRHCLAAIMRYCMDMDLKEIAKNMGGKDHSTVINNLKKFDILRDNSPDFRSKANLAMADYAAGQKDLAEIS